MMTREAWGAKPANIANMLKHDGPYKGIVVHNTATPQAAWKHKTTKQKLQDIQFGHQKNPHLFRKDMIKVQGKWGDFAYHYYIDIDGQIAAARDPQYQGDSGTYYDMSGQLLVVLEGNFDKDPTNAKQLASLDAIVAWLASKHGLSADQITGHRQNFRVGTTKTVSTQCPGANLEKYLPELRRKTAAALQSK